MHEFLFTFLDSIAPGNRVTGSTLKGKNLLLQEQKKAAGSSTTNSTTLHVITEQLFQMMAPNQRFSQGLHKPLQLLQS